MCGGVWKDEREGCCVMKKKRVMYRGIERNIEKRRMVE